MPRPYIGDGYDLEFCIDPAAKNYAGLDNVGLFPLCRFVGRPMAHHQASSVMREANQDQERVDQIYAAAIAERINGWSYRDDDGNWKKFDDCDGNPIQPTAATVGGLQYNLFCRLRDIILGIAPADRDPEKADAKKPTTTEDNAKN